MILSDNETKVDLLNNEPIAKTIVELLRKRSEHPITIGVHGDWGAGKSSVLEMVEASLSDEDQVLCLKFNGWRFQGFEDAKIALIEGIVTELLKKRPLLTKTTSVVKDVFHRIDLLKVAKRGGALIAAAASFYTGHHQLGTMGMIASLEGMVADPANLTKDKLGQVLDGAKELLKEQDKEKSSNIPEEIAEFRKAFDKQQSGLQPDWWRSKFWTKPWFGPASCSSTSETSCWGSTGVELVSVGSQSRRRMVVRASGTRVPSSRGLVRGCTRSTPSTPGMVPSMRSKELFSSIRTMTCWISIVAP